MQGIENCLKHKVFTGVCTSVCQTNLDLVNEQWIDRLIDMGVLYTWFHIYRPMGPDACPDLCLTPEQQLYVRKFVVEMRARKPIIIVDAYFDGEGRKEGIRQFIDEKSYKPGLSAYDINKQSGK